MIAIKAELHPLAAFAKSRCSGVSFVSSRRLVIPMMPFIGVRISWLMVARNWDFNRASSKASSRAVASSFSIRVRSSISPFSR